MKLILSITFFFLVVSVYSVEQKGAFRIDAPGIKADFFEEHMGSLKKFELKATEKGYVTYKNDGNPLSWEVFVPDSYNPSQPAGILTYINSANRGNLPRSYKELLKKHNLIAIGANTGGNEIWTYWRQILAISAVHKIKEKYKVDEDRIFITGTSGGGRVTSLLAIAKPEIFKGAIYLIGCNRWGKEVSPQAIKLAKKNYFVFITGTKDFNLEDTKGVHRYYKENGFKDNTKLIIVEGMKHSNPPANEFDSALKFLDTPKEKRKNETLTEAVKAEKNKQYAKAMQLFAKAAGYGSKEAVEKYEAYNQEIKAMYKTAEDAEAVRDFVLCLNTYDAIHKKFGVDLGKAAYDKSKSLKRDKQVVLEIKAMAYFLKIEKALKKGNTNEKVQAALKKVIDTCPESFAAKRAQEELDKIGG